MYHGAASPPKSKSPARFIVSRNSTELVAVASLFWFLCDWRWFRFLLSPQEAAGAGTIFVDVLWAMVVLVGCSMSLGGCMVAYRHFKAGGGGAPMYLPVQAAVSPHTLQPLLKLEPVVS